MTTTCPQVGDMFDFIITITDGRIPIDVSSATTKQLLLQKPGSSTFITKTASFVNTGVDGKVHYDFLTGEIDIDGEWHWQVYIVTPAGNFHTNVYPLTIKPNLPV
jgi:hypothetical protein